MTTPSLKLAINRTVAPRLPLGDFLALAARSGAEAVEIRNDIAGRELADGTRAAEVRSRIADAGLKVASVNALQRFNDWTAEREREARTLIAHAAALGAPGIVMCPVIDTNHGWSIAELAAKLRHALRELMPIVASYGVTGYVEPLGMAGSTLKHQEIAVEAIADVGGSGPLALCYDTFQYYRARDTAFHPSYIGLVHVSGITRTDLRRETLTEPDRGFVDGADIAGNISQLQRLREAGYAGYISMEPFDPAIQDKADVSAELAASFAFIRDEISRSEITHRRDGEGTP